MRRRSVSPGFRLPPLLVFLAVLGLQLTPLGSGAAASPEESGLTAALPIAGPPLPSCPAELETADRGGFGGGHAAGPRAAAPRSTAHDGACADVFGAWLTSDLLDRAGRRSAPSTAPPTSPV